MTDNQQGWRKSSFSAGNGACVQLRRTKKGFDIGDTKDPNGPILEGISASDLRSFLADIKKV